MRCRRLRPDRPSQRCDRRLRRSGPAQSWLPRSVLARKGLGAVGVALGLGVLAGCTTSAASTPNAAQTCGATRTGVNVPVIIKVSKGPVSCATALKVENSYAAAVRSGQIRGNGGGAPVTVSGWTCRGFPTPEILKTGETSACRNGGSEIVAILPPPSAPSVPITPTASS
jgi:hypothetical protein